MVSGVGFPDLVVHPVERLLWRLTSHDNLWPPRVVARRKGPTGLCPNPLDTDPYLLCRRKNKGEVESLVAF